MRRSVSLACLILSITLVPRVADAAFITFTDVANDVTLVSVSTNLEFPVIATTANSASVTGFIHPGNSPSNITPGSRSAGLFEPGSSTLLDAYVLLTVGDLRFDPIFGAAQDISLSYVRQQIAVTALPGTFPFGGGLALNGTVQDLSAFLGTVPEGLTVGVQVLPEPSSLLLLGTGALALVRRIRARTCP
jgi:PEP-CTERM motif